MITIEITDAMIIKAREMEAEVLKNLKETPNYTGFSIPDRFYVGFMGELIFESFLKDNNKKYTYTVKLDGNSQGGDFIISAHRELQAEVKASAHPNARNIMIPEAQFNHRTFDLYIGIKISNRFGYIYGYCFKNMFVLAKDGFNNNKTPTYYIGFDKLYSIDKLLQKLH